MPEQQQNASFVGRFANRIAAANAEASSRPVDLGDMRLPAGIRDGIAKVTSLYTKRQDKDGAGTPKGEVFLRAAAVAIWPRELNGVKVEGCALRAKIISLCDMPATKFKEATTFEQNFGLMVNLLRSLGSKPCLEKDPVKIEMYWLSELKRLVSPGRPPIYVSFTTRGFTPEPTASNPKPELVVIEEWHGLADQKAVEAALSAKGPGSGVRSIPPAPNGLPTQRVQSRPVQEVNQNNGVRETPVEEPTSDIARAANDLVDSLVKAMNDDPEGESEEARIAGERLAEMAAQNGWSQEEIENANWNEVGQMALNLMEGGAGDTSPEYRAADDGNPAVTVGSHWMFCKRTKDGSKLKNAKGEEFPSAEVEVVSVDTEKKTCRLKTKEGRDIVDVKTKQPVEVKWEWLETVPY